MFKSDAEVESLLNHPNNKAIVIGMGKGNSLNSTRGTDVSRTKRTTEEKSDIAVLGELLGNRVAGPMMGVSSDRVSLYRSGRTGTRIDEDLRVENAKRLDTIRTKAIDKVELFLEMLNNDKAIKMRGRDMAASAEKMVNIFEKLGPKVNQPGSNIQIIFHAPKVRASVDYQAIDVEAVTE